MKIAHYIASCNVCSRRAAERLVKEGLVQVNGVTCDNVAHRICDTDIVAVNNKIINVETARLWCYYKPMKVLTTHKADFDADTVFDLVYDRIGYVISVGRLDYMSEGLLLLTNSNTLAEKLMNSAVPRTYEVWLDQDIYDEDFEFARKPFVIDGVHYKAWDILYIDGRCVVIKLYEGKNREIRKVCEYAGYHVRRLLRTAYGPYELDVKPNQLKEVEIVQTITDRDNFEINR